LLAPLPLLLVPELLLLNLPEKLVLVLLGQLNPHLLLVILVQISLLLGPPRAQYVPVGVSEQSTLGSDSAADVQE